MNFWQSSLRRPKRLWWRRAMFQIHLWTGIGLGLYVLVISLSGSAIVFRNELYKSLFPGPLRVPVSGPRLSKDAMKQAVRRAWPGYSVTYLWDGKRPDEATEVWMERDTGSPNKKARLFDPFTGRDLGSSRPFSIVALAWLSSLHTDLLGGKTGRVINGVLAIFVTAISISGFAIWWPGLGRLRRSLSIRWRANWKRLNWDLHSVVGIWSFAFVFIWGVTGVFLVFPKPFQMAVNHFSHLELYGETSSLAVPAESVSTILAVADTTVAPAPVPRRRLRPPIKRSAGDIFLRWFYYLHFGNFAGWQGKAAWVALGLVPPFLFVTGAIMWWNRVLGPRYRRLKVNSAEPA